METKITQGIFIRLFENYSDELTKLSKISTISRGYELYKKFEVIRLFNTKQKDNTGKEIYKIVVTTEYAYDALNLIEKYCDKGLSNRYRLLSRTSPKYNINRNPECKEYEGVAVDPKARTIMIEGMDFYNIAEITNTYWITDSYNLFLKKYKNSKSSIDCKKFWFIPRPPDASEQFEQEMGKPYGADD